MENIPLYNTVLLKTYMDLLEEKYPNVDIDELLNYSGISRYELEDRGHWVTQKQVNLFHEFLLKRTNNPHISYDAGRFATQSKSSSLLRQYAMGFVTPNVAYWMLSKISATITKHANVESSRVSPSKFSITITPKSDIKEEHFQCENRIGLFEGLSKIFTNNYAQVEHPECYHKGYKSCKYIVSWKTTPTSIWKLISRYTSALSFLSSIILFFFIPFHYWLYYFLFVLLSAISAFLVYISLSKNDLNKSIESQQNVAEQLINQFNVRYNELTLIKEIGEAASRILDPQELLNFTIDALQKHLQFKRGMIMLTNHEKTNLIYTGGFGYNKKEETFLKNTTFSLDNPQSQGIFNLSYHSQKPFIINNIKDIETNFSEKSLKFIKDLNVKSFICVPIIYEGKSEGILAVDNIKTGTNLTQSDLSLLSGIAHQISISLNNALSHKKLKENEERFRNLSNNSPDIIYQTNIAGKIIYVNPAWKELLGHTIFDVINKNLISFVRQEEKGEFVQLLNDIVNKKITVRDKNFIFLNNKDLPRYVTFTGTPDIDSDGNVIGIMGTLKDISRLRSMEAQLLQASKMEAIGTLTGGVAHDFNNIIQAIMGYNQIMMSGRKDSATHKQYLENVKELITRSRELVQQLLLYGRKSDTDLKSININNELLNIQKLLSKSIPKMIEIKNELAEDIYSVMADSNQIGQILMNLVINARDAMGDSGAITISTKNLSFDKSLHMYGTEVSKGKYISLCVSDTGCGIDKDIMPHIFEPFFTTKEEGKGTGLGLSVVHGLIQSMDGYIFCESVLERGTTFEILLPAVEHDITSHIVVDEQSAKIPRGKEKLLIVDDENYVLETVKESLNSYGYKVLTADSADQALKVYSTNKDKINLVLLDLNMPGIGGKRCLIDLLAINKNAKILMTSGYTTSEQVKDLINAGAAGFLNKPYKTEELLKSIRDIIDTAT